MTKNAGQSVSVIFEDLNCCLIALHRGLCYLNNKEGRKKTTAKKQMQKNKCRFVPVSSQNAKSQLLLTNNNNNDVPCRFC